ncbi:MAG: hypothetical protein WAO98_01360 [Alphaproteobacteria bacterium]
MSRQQLDGLFTHYSHVFIMEWVGERDPKGAQIDGKGIILGDACQIRSLAGNTKLGEYEKLREFSGALSRTVFIATNCSSATNPNGTPCQEITDERALWMVTSPARDNVHKLPKRGIRLAAGS